MHKVHEYKSHKYVIEGYSVGNTEPDQFLFSLILIILYYSLYYDVIIPAKNILFHEISLSWLALSKTLSLPRR